jgi:hypothetical protein
VNELEAVHDGHHEVEKDPKQFPDDARVRLPLRIPR